MYSLALLKSEPCSVWITQINLTLQYGLWLYLYGYCEKTNCFALFSHCGKTQKKIPILIADRCYLAKVPLFPVATLWMFMYKALDNQQQMSTSEKSLLNCEHHSRKKPTEFREFTAKEACGIRGKIRAKLTCPVVSMQWTTNSAFKWYGPALTSNCSGAC